MRSVLVTLALLTLAGCPRSRGAVEPKAATTSAKPSTDLAAAFGTPTSDDATDDDHRLDDLRPKVHDLDVVHLDVVGRDADGEPIIEATTPGPLLDQGNEAFNAGKLDDAEGWYRKLTTEFPDSALAPAALYNIALVREKQGAPDEAIRAYLELAAAYPASLEAQEGQLRAAALLADRERWREAGEVLDQILARTDLAREVRLEAFARKGYVLLEQGLLDDAETALREAIAVWRRASRIDDPYYIAMAYFYLGDVEARRFDRQPVRSADAALPADMDAKRALLLRAYAHWKEALDFKHAYWATASGYRMSQIFYDYWIAAVRAPFPDGMTAEARPRYVAEVHDRVRENLVKALEGHQANVGLAEVYGVDTSWSLASKTRAAEIMAILDREARGEAVVPPITARSNEAVGR